MVRHRSSGRRHWILDYRPTPSRGKLPAACRPAVPTADAFDWQRAAMAMMTVAAHASFRSAVKLPQARYSITLRSAKFRARHLLQCMSSRHSAGQGTGQQKLT